MADADRAHGEEIMGSELLGDMTSQELRYSIRTVADWISEYLAEVSRYPVLAQVRPGEIRDRLPPGCPERGEPFHAILRDFEELILPGVTHWNHPGFFAYFSITGKDISTPPRMLVGQRAVMVLSRVKKRAPSGPCMW